MSIEAIDIVPAGPTGTPAGTSIVPTRKPKIEDRLEELQTRLDLVRRRAGHDLAELRQELRTRADWHTWYRTRTGYFLASAFLVGFLVGRRR